MSIELKNDRDRLSYALALNISSSVRQMPLDLNLQLIGEAVRGLMNGDEVALSHEEYDKLMRQIQSLLQENAKKNADSSASANLEAGKKFLAGNRTREGVKTTSSGLQYIVLKDGEGVRPKADDTVRVHYEGKLIDDRVFDSSIKRGEPAEFPVNQVIAGWTEALQLMKTGSKYRLFIPAELAYGEQGAGNVIPPHSTLIFDVELLDIVKPNGK